MQELFFIANKVYLNFVTGNYHEALVNLNIILNNKKSNVRQDINSWTRIFQLLIHFEKGNTELLPYLIKSIYRDLLQKNKLYKTEKIFIQFIRHKLAPVKSKKDQIAAFKVLKDELMKACNDPLEAGFQENNIVINWLESKIQNQTIEDILREKSGYVLEGEE